jgi:chromosome segregation ATPase
MSKEFDQIIKEIAKQNKELHNLDNQISKEVIKDIYDMKKSIKAMENKISKIDQTIEKVYELINNITIFIEDAEAINDMNIDDDDEEDWTPYDERNFQYNDDNDEEDIGGDNYWSNHEDES